MSMGLRVRSSRRTPFPRQTGAGSGAFLGETALAQSRRV